eukprot:UN09928
MLDIELCAKFVDEYNLDPCVSIDSERNTLLHYAVKFDDQLILEKVFDIMKGVYICGLPTARNIHGETAIFTAVQQGNVEIFNIP